MSTPSEYTTYFTLILPTVGGSAVDWATWSNQNWVTVDSALQTLTSTKVSANPSDGVLYGRMNEEWVAIVVDGGTVTVGIGEAPEDGQYYVRRNATWVESAAIIEAAVVAGIDDALASTERAYSTTGVIIGADVDYVSETLSNSQVYNASIKCRVVGLFDCVSAGTFVATVSVSFGGNLAWQGSVKFEADDAVTVPFILDFALADFAGTQQLAGTLLYGDPYAEAAGSGYGGTSLQTSDAPAQVNGSPFFGLTAFDLSVVGTKDLVVNFAMVSGPGLSGIDLRSRFVSRENY